MVRPGRQCFCCSPGEKINAELTGWTPTGELGINFSFLSLWYDQAMTVFLLLPRRKINAELTGWTPTGELGINFSFSSLWYDQAMTAAAPPERKLMPNSPVGLQPVSWELIFPFCRCGTTRQGQCFCCSPGEKINAELTGWTPTGELGINFSFLSLWYDPARTVFLLLPRREN